MLPLGAKVLGKRIENGFLETELGLDFKSTFKA